MFTTSESTAKLDVALAKAQATVEAALKAKVNPAFRSKYADLHAVWEACREALTSQGVSVTQWPLHTDDGRLHLLTRLACDGEWMQAEFSLPVSKPDAHGYGSATTYARRFCLAAAVGVVADEDDDGNAATEKKPEPTRTRRETTPPPSKPETTPADVQQAFPGTTDVTALLLDLRGWLEKGGIPASEVCAAYSVEQLEDLNPKQIHAAIQRAKAKVARAAQKKAEGK